MAITVLAAASAAAAAAAAGTTMTLAVVSGWLLTVANTGDSNAIIDCGDSVQEITFSHRIQVTTWSKMGSSCDQFL
jgi:serine/threonine protein phosphatase PrpC